MNKLKIAFLLVAAVIVGQAFTACRHTKTYAERKKDEREAINRFIDKNNITVISEEDYCAHDTMTDVLKNEFVLFKESGIYMQVINRGGKEYLKDGRHEIIFRFNMSRIYENGTDSLWNTNLQGTPDPDVMTVTKSGTTYSGTFSRGELMNAWGESAVPTGLLSPFKYLKVGRLMGERGKVRLIVPHSESFMQIKRYVYPCYFEITYQLGR
ncbi:MAG: DUF4827 domain-containing protein [Phocaeicola sp.]|uniref:DUF4827 domain-containing protein n=1 Tax=Phocaeicola TaxID=909656 RepID=UPI00234EF800|nr:DUF4827 domain-containing protein [Phocaeicola oris]MCE2616204.1 DUF4827 domain-containing protein [Phocaeicola oris]